VVGIELPDHGALLNLLVNRGMTNEDAPRVFDGRREWILIAPLATQTHDAGGSQAVIALMGHQPLLQRTVGDIVVGQDARPAGNLRVPDVF